MTGSVNGSKISRFFEWPLDQDWKGITVKNDHLEYVELKCQRMMNFLSFVEEVVAIKFYV